MSMRADIRIEHFDTFAELTPHAQRDVMSLIALGKLSATDLDEYQGLLLARETTSAQLLGCVGIEWRQPNAYMESLVVHPDTRRRRIGAYLTDQLFDEFVVPNDELDSLTALTLFWNNRFYASVGFTQIDARAAKQVDDIAGKAKHKYCTAWRKYKSPGE